MKQLNSAELAHARQLQDDLVALVNVERTENGLQPITPLSLLQLLLSSQIVIGRQSSRL